MVDFSTFCYVANFQFYPLNNSQSTVENCFLFSPFMTLELSQK